jgi:hypothetical protein
MGTYKYSIQALLHLVKRTGRVRNVPNVLPHRELRDSRLDTKQVDPHLAVAVKWNRLGWRRRREFKWICVYGLLSKGTR